MNVLRGWAIVPSLAMALFASGFVDQAEVKKTESRQHHSKQAAPQVHSNRGTSQAQGMMNAGGSQVRGMSAGGGRRGGGGGRRGYSGNAYRGRNMMRNQYNGNGQVILELRSAANSLSQANHQGQGQGQGQGKGQGQGHQTKALQQVLTAIRHLEPPAVRRNQASPTAIAKASVRNGNGVGGQAAGGVGANGKGNGNRKNRNAQNGSAGQLQNALQTLNGVHAQLTNFGTTRSHAQALVSVQHAIQELNQALAVR